MKEGIGLSIHVCISFRTVRPLRGHFSINMAHAHEACKQLCQADEHLNNLSQLSRMSCAAAVRRRIEAASRGAVEAEDI